MSDRRRSSPPLGADGTEAPDADDSVRTPRPGPIRRTAPVRILVDVDDPAHVHLFRYAVEELEARGHRTLVTARETARTTELLDAYGIDHRPLSGTGEGLLDVARERLDHERRLLAVAHRFDPDVIVGGLTPAAAHVARLVGARSVVYDDGAASRTAAWLTRPLANVVCTPTTAAPRTLDRSLGGRAVRYDGYRELAYLHPNRFDPGAVDLRTYGVDPEDPYYVVQFDSLDGHQGRGRSQSRGSGRVRGDGPAPGPGQGRGAGLSRAGARRLVEFLDGHGTVYVSGGTPLPPAVEADRLPVPPHAFHHLLAGAALAVGDSGTMATEAALLGTPAVRTSAAADDDASTVRELERRYGLVCSTADEDDALRAVHSLVADVATGAAWQRRRARLLAETVDVTGQMIDLVVGEGRDRD